MRTTEKLKTEEIDTIRKPIVIIDKTLNKYDNIVMFPEKLAKTNEILKRTGHPKNYLKEK